MSTPGRIAAQSAVAVLGSAVLLALAAALPRGVQTAQPLLIPASEVRGAHLTLDGDGETFELTPGIPAYWQLGVTTRAASLSALVAQITATGTLTAAAHDATISLAICSTPWAHTSCRTGGTQLLNAHPLAGLDADLIPLKIDGRVPARSYLMARVQLPRPTAGARSGAGQAVVTLHITAQGGDSPGSSRHITPLQESGLARTGTRVGIAAALALAATLTGLLLAAITRHRNRQDGP